MSDKVTPITPNQDAIMRTRGLPAQYIEGGPGAEDPRLAAKDAEIVRLREVLKKYRNDYCEGWCCESDGIFDDCGGCPAKAALGSPAPQQRSDGE